MASPETTDAEIVAHALQCRRWSVEYDLDNLYWNAATSKKQRKRNAEARASLVLELARLNAQLARMIPEAILQ